ncbi:cytidine deaminase [Salegentibacter salarius]|uniref:Cytidine deaminase n=1 Tax=Salegentibacter salarius TaxID=435906 RepID=A0A2N0TYK1_9FLAO|nr:cytidine deaminase [Salegentibacter salarius]OEY73063.1 cytidine deaminase [Salegentibacter salarius]PKD19809.1 cytidine deaminase [Salegentibacter salarius]SLJ86907.1 cytidine deaminase [Salegentibacter salarius]
MKPFKVTSNFEVYDAVEELPEAIQDLMKEAVLARDNAYAPYSQFKVGAALALDNNEVVTGSNQENASYPSGLCAERTAIYYAGARYPESQIENIAISAKSMKHKVEAPVPPCGACRQALVEYEVRQEAEIAVYFMGESGKVMKANSIKDLLPLIFDNSAL